MSDPADTDATHYTAVLETRVAYLRFNFKADVEITQLSPPEKIEAKVEAIPLGIAGRLTATATTHLVESDGQTIIQYSIDATLTGKLGSMGQPVLKSKAKEMEKHFTARLFVIFPLPGAARLRRACGDWRDGDRDVCGGRHDRKANDGVGHAGVG